jgi:hypothetical protein
VAGVMIGVDSHKGSHTAVVLDAGEVVLGQVRVTARTDQLLRLQQCPAVAGSSVGGRRRARPGSAAYLAAAWRRRAGRGRATQTRRTVLRLRQVELLAAEFGRTKVSDCVSFRGGPSCPRDGGVKRPHVQIVGAVRPRCSGTAVRVVLRGSLRQHDRNAPVGVLLPSA